jgi:hypothetical protein
LPAVLSSTGTVVSSVLRYLEARINDAINRYRGMSRSTAFSIQPPIVERSRSTPWRARMPSWRYSG